MNSKVSLIVVDNFYENPDSIFDNLFNSGFHRAYPPIDSTVGYQNRNRDQWFASNNTDKSDWIREKFENIISKKIDKPFWDSSIHWNGRFLVKLENAGMHFHCHDNNSRGLEDGNDVGPDGWSAVIFMNKKNPIDQGFFTALVDKKNIPSDSIFLNPDHVIYDSVIGNVYNRCVLFRGNIFHTGAGGMGNEIEDGRIIQGFFFKEVE
tara:strand:+ start:410 stop:1030 length:621 start_codon:yes stop_codon:yes gene_type:complete